MSLIGAMPQTITWKQVRQPRSVVVGASWTLLAQRHSACPAARPQNRVPGHDTSRQRRGNDEEAEGKGREKERGKDKVQAKEKEGKKRDKETVAKKRQKRTQIEADGVTERKGKVNANKLRKRETESTDRDR